MRKIALGIICSTFIATSAWAADPATTTTTTTRLVTSGALDGITFTTPARAEQAAPAPAPEPAPKRVKTTVGADFPSVYFFRGYQQEADAAFTFQPIIDVAFTGSAASANVGLFNSFHTGSLKDSGNGYYETDFYAAVTVKNIKTTYTAYTYPNLTDATIHELMFSTTFSNVVAPSVAVAFEFNKASGANKGVYLELGINPAIPMKDGSPVTLNIPVKFGLALDDDYYFGDTFGYFSGGLTLGVPFAKGEVHGGVLFYAFGDQVKIYNGQDKSGDVVGNIGFTVGF